MVGSWFLLGWLAGIATLAVVSIITIECTRKTETSEDFVKKLIEKKGWTEARWDLETAYKGKYMRIWRRLYKKHIEGEDKND